ncbi:MAG: ribosomal protein L31 [uncultured bacterium]|nr:MAG: ribosomal protein L31 [uncultured bacterium]
MKAQIHPKWFKDAKVTCACGNTFTAGAVVESIYVEVCSQCHPFYTGQMKFLDTAGRVEKFKTRMTSVSKKNISKTDKRKLKREKKIQAELNRPDSLEQLRKNV